MNMFSYPKEPSKTMNTSTNSSSNTEDFSFPVMSTNPLSNFMLASSSASSSSLWRISSRVYHHPEEFYQGEEEDSNVSDHQMEVRSMCEEIIPSWRDVERSASSASFHSKEFEVEESMDYLWEDFNEEDKDKERSNCEEMGFMQVTKMSRRPNSSGSSSTKMLVIGKLLKGLVSIRKSAQLKLSKARF